MAVELMLRMAWFNLWTGGVILDIVFGACVERWNEGDKWNG